MFELNDTASNPEITTDSNFLTSETPVVDREEPKLIDESLLIETLTLSFQDTNNNLYSDQFETEAETLTPSASIENIADQSSELNVVFFDVFDETSEDVDEDSTPTFVNDHERDFLKYQSAKKSFHRSISTPFGRQMVYQDHNSSQVS
jgi:hypothetical protein